MIVSAARVVEQLSQHIAEQVRWVEGVPEWYGA